MSDCKDKLYSLYGFLLSLKRAKDDICVLKFVAEKAMWSVTTHLRSVMIQSKFQLELEWYEYHVQENAEEFQAKVQKN